MGSICIMRFTSEIKCVVSCDNLVIGYVEDEGLTAAIPCGNHFFTFSPFPSSGFCLPISMYIDVCSPSFCPEGISLKLISDSEILCHISFYTVKNEVPHILSHCDEDDTSVIIYEDNGINISFIKDGSPISAMHIKNSCTNFSTISYYNKLIACVDDITVFTDMQNLRDISIIKNSEFKSGKVIEHTGHPEDAVILHDLLGKSSILEPPSPDNHAIITLALAIHYKSKELIYRLLNRSLLESLTFEDISEFFGSFNSIEYELCTNKKLCLSYELYPRIFEIRSFEAELLSDGKIANITEV